MAELGIQGASIQFFAAFPWTGVVSRGTIPEAIQLEAINASQSFFFQRFFSAAKADYTRRLTTNIFYRSFSGIDHFQASADEIQRGFSQSTW